MYVKNIKNSSKISGWLNKLLNRENINAQG